MTEICMRCVKPIVPGEAYIRVNAPTRADAPVHLKCIDSGKKTEPRMQIVEDGNDEDT